MIKMTDKYHVEWETEELGQIADEDNNYLSVDEVCDILNQQKNKLTEYEKEIGDLHNALIKDNNLQAEIYRLCDSALNSGNIDFDVMFNTLKTIQEKVDYKNKIRGIK